MSAQRWFNADRFERECAEADRQARDVRSRTLVIVESPSGRTIMTLADLDDRAWVVSPWSTLRPDPPLRSGVAEMEQGAGWNIITDMDS